MIEKSDLTDLIRVMNEKDNNYYLSADITKLTLPRNIRFFMRDCKASQMGKSMHNPFMLIFNFETSAGVILDDKIIRLDPGKALLIFPNQFHHYSLLENKKLLWLFCAFELKDFSHIKGLKNTPVPFNAEIVSNLYFILNKYTEGINKKWIPYFTRQIAARVNLLLEQLLEALEWKKYSDDNADFEKASNRTSRLLSDASMFIRENLDKSISSKDIAFRLSVSPGHLRNVFHQNLGFGPGHYLRYVRMHRACVLMDTTDDNLENIALCCGYNSLFSFSRAFKKDKGIAPSEYRKKFCK